jgi:dual oxidase
MCKVLIDKAPLIEKPGGGRSNRIRCSSTVDNDIRVGVVFCRPPVIGQQLADQCNQMNAKARTEGRKIEYRFMIEVFG